jgi:hypothetical protein
MPSLRTTEMKNRYKEYLNSHPSDGSCPICSKEAIKNFKYWKITDNSFPYDLIASKHQMIVPNRHVAEEELLSDELDELIKIKREFIDTEFDYIIEATTKNKSVPGHFHLHLIVGKN